MDVDEGGGPVLWWAYGQKHQFWEDVLDISDL